VSQQDAMRQALEADIPAILALTRAAYAKWVPVIGREPMPMTANYADAVREHRFDLIEFDGELVALLETISAEDHLLIENLAVAPSYQGRGLGRKLMAHAERLAMSLGYREIRLYTNKLFASNVELYGRLGYRVEREEAFRGGTTVHMGKAIPQSPAPKAEDLMPADGGLENRDRRLRIEAESVVRQQLDAYNARDIDAFMKCWMDDCQYFEFPSRLLAQGAAAVRERHVVRFEEPDLCGKLINRIPLDNLVVDHETVTRNYPEGSGEVDVVAIYEILDGKIAKAWFKMGKPRLHGLGS